MVRAVYAGVRAWAAILALLLLGAKPIPMPDVATDYDLCMGTAEQARLAVEKAWTLHREGPLGFWYRSPHDLWRALVVVIKGQFVGILIEDAEGWVACHLEHPAPSPTPANKP